MIDQEYKYETHVHTSQGSLCARSTGAELVDYYMANGYSGMIVTDHFVGSDSFAAKDEKTWEKKVDKFLAGYLDAKKRAEGLGFNVFLGMEYCYRNTEFIFFNLSTETLYNGEDYFTREELSEMLAWVKDQGGYIIHVHPFRLSRRINTIRLLPNYTDAVEIFNGQNVFSWPEANNYAFEYSKAANLPATSGTDLHGTDSIISGGMIFDHKITTDKELVKVIESGKGKLIKKSLL